MTEQSIATIVTSVMGGLTTVLLAWIAFKQNQIKSQTDAAALKVKEVAETLKASTKVTDDKLNGMSTVLDTTHSLVNSAMGLQLAMHKETTRHFAEAVPTAFNIEAAKRAEQAYNDHKTKQASADARTKANL